ncbi:MAG: exopolyphosphatase [Proteobacteria bacterium]|nr:exopolyphosphatase [Pseudomonadota bacterium]MBU1138130.1 exopolyphosphatase [Pseudomonadota bacterium]MBU1232768.1 exopolyphosphatase [Pseudomonadota bacterium]MBU1418163.1 exopolyphosphatase [Pseudomonadota bacterium]MBU1456732.1 exopolyphosphatase [Pseudomonadota bacterium]
MNDPQQKQQHLAAIDLGSNSFHMVVARIENGHIHILDRLKEMVRLGAGLDKNGNLSLEAQSRALYCLERFGERVEHLPQGSVAAVGTKTLRQAKNARLFLQHASEVLGHPISVIGGKEEARLVYLGVSHSLVADDGKRLVMDIGGGSTELIIGENFEPLHLRSLDMGCVSMSRKFFPNGKLTKKYWKEAGIAAHLELRPERLSFQEVGWSSATGASGTIKAVGKVVSGLGLESYNITLDSLYRIRDIMIKAGHLKNLDLPGLNSDRQPVFAGGLAILIATFEALKIKTMQVSEGALREGLLYERLGRIQSEDTRLKTVSSVQQRFQISQQHARRVSKTAHRLLTACEKSWNLRLEDAELLHWASSLHEIGLAVSLNGYQKHGAYLLDNADLPGFSFEEQDLMSVLVRCHRSKISKKLFKELPNGSQQTVLRLVVLLRLATLLHRSRQEETAVIEKIVANENTLTLEFAKDELIIHPLQLASLEQEAKYLKNVGFELRFS